MSEVRIILDEIQLANLKNTVYQSLIDEIQRARNDVGLEKRYLNKKEIYLYLHVANNTLDKWVEMGLPKITIAGSVRYARFAIDEWLSSFPEYA